LLGLDVNPPPQVTAHQIDQHGCQHQNHAEPDTPVTMGMFLIRRMAMMNIVAIWIFKPVVIVL
jgi:hypothetical protein